MTTTTTSTSIETAVLNALGRDADMPASVLRKLARSENEEVRLQAAYNQNTPLDVLVELVKTTGDSNHQAFTAQQTGAVVIEKRRAELQRELKQLEEFASELNQQY